MLKNIQNEICRKLDILEDCLVKLEASELNEDNLRFIEDNKEVLGVSLYRKFIQYLVDEFFLIDEHSDGSEKFLSMFQIIDVMQSESTLRFKNHYSEYAFGRDYVEQVGVSDEYSFKIKLKEYK